MMMEEEIERTKEEIKGIEEACEKVQEVLDKVTQGVDLNISPPSFVVKQVDEGIMEDIIEEKETKETTDTVPEIVERKWYEDEKLMNLWNGNST